jgi:anti-sigma-K factor RskA
MKQAHATTERHKPERAGFLARWWTGVLVPTGVVLAVAAIFLWNENRKLDRQLAALRATAQQEQQQLQHAREVVDLVSAPDTIAVALAAQPGQPQGAARVLYNAKMGVLMYDGALVPAPSGKSYQLWLVPKQGSPISAGVFNPAGGMADHWTMKLSPGIAPAAFAVTLEPSGGAPQPTGPEVLVGAAS